MCDMTVAARMGQTSEQILEVKKRLLPNGRRTLKMVICLNTSPLSWKHRWRKCRRVWENQMPSGSASIYWQEKSIRCISVFWSVFWTQDKRSPCKHSYTETLLCYQRRTMRKCFVDVSFDFERNGSPSNYKKYKFNPY